MGRGMDGWVDGMDKGRWDGWMGRWDGWTDLLLQILIKACNTNHLCLKELVDDSNIFKNISLKNTYTIQHKNNRQSITSDTVYTITI